MSLDSMSPDSMSLVEAQRAFRAYLLDQPDAGLPAMPSLVPDRAVDGLAVYHNAYRAQLVAALKDSFERTWAWLGDSGFDAAARTHIAAVPPSSWTLNAYGQRFAATLDQLYPDDPEIAEIATLDWALRRAFDGPDADPINPERLAEVDWDHAVIILAPTLATIKVVTNAAVLWNAMAEGEMPPPVALLPQPATVRIWRDGLSPRFITIDESEAVALDAVRDGAGFAQLCEALAKTMGVEAAVERAGGLLGAWLGDGLIIDIA